MDERMRGAAPWSAVAPATPHRPPAHVPPRDTVQHITSQRLFSGASEVQIEHNGSVYRLKQTSLGKLILTK